MLETFRVLVLNADYRPLSYFPLSLWSWQEAIKATFMNRVVIVAEYEIFVHSPSCKIPLPSVIALKNYVPLRRNPAFSRFNVFLRDKFLCQYCGDRYPLEELTFDHVLPKSLGGNTNWKNVVTACSKCNLEKGNCFSGENGHFPKNVPRVPTTHELHEAGKYFPPPFLHQSWRDYLYWNS